MLLNVCVHSFSFFVVYESHLSSLAILVRFVVTVSFVCLLLLLELLA